MRPDPAVPWSKSETAATSNRGKIYLLEPFMNKQVAWDSEYYLGIAVGGYDDPAAGRVTNPMTGQPVIKNYSFFPLYPLVMSAVLKPLAWLGMEPLAAGVAAGLGVTLLGTLAGMLALWHLAFGLFDQASAGRAVFYLLIFPTAFFFAMVYTEGLFIGLAFWSLLLSRRRQWLWASILAGLAAWTRAHGIALFIPLALAWWSEVRRPSTGEGAWLPAPDGPSEPQVPGQAGQPLRLSLSPARLVQGALALLPLASYAAWRMSPLGKGWAELQSFYFGRGVLAVGKTLGDIGYMYEYAQTQPQAAVYFSLEAAAVLLALAAAVWLLKYDRPVALFGLAVILLSVFSGSAQSMARYMLIAPPTYLLLARLGRSQAFDRLWTLASILLLGMSAMLFAFDFWVG
jgi:hypothetical protein